VRYFVHGVDRENIDEQLEGLAESHWAYMDEMGATVLTRIPAAEYPRINEAAAALTSGSDYTDEVEFGLDLILDGLERLRRVPAYLGPAGWLGLDLDERTDLEEVGGEDGGWGRSPRGPTGYAAEYAEGVVG
jgi:hypothetical protein